MAETPAQDVKSLFKRWRSGDADAGVTMAQRFSDWYYAITVMRLGDQNARAPLERACQTFAQRIMDVTNADELIDFAHHIVLEEVRQSGERHKGSDQPNTMTAGRPPSELLAEALKGLSSQQVKVLHQTYAERTPMGAIHLDLPAEVLQARHALKLHLNQIAEIPFTILPEQPNPDWAPLPLYEADRLQNTEEERALEQWLLTDLDLCKDIAEFSAFAHAIRVGALQSAKAPAPTPRPDRQPEAITPTSRPVPASAASPEPSEGGGSGTIARIAVVGMIIVVVLALAKMLMG